MDGGARSGRSGAGAGGANSNTNSRNTVELMNSSFGKKAMDAVSRGAASGVRAAHEGIDPRWLPRSMSSNNLEDIKKEEVIPKPPIRSSRTVEDMVVRSAGDGDEDAKPAHESSEYESSVEGGDRLANPNAYRKSAPARVEAEHKSAPKSSESEADRSSISSEFESSSSDDGGANQSEKVMTHSGSATRIGLLDKYYSFS